MSTTLANNICKAQTLAAISVGIFRYDTMRECTLRSCRINVPLHPSPMIELQISLIARFSTLCKFSNHHRLFPGLSDGISLLLLACLLACLQQPRKLGAHGLTWYFTRETTKPQSRRHNPRFIAKKFRNTTRTAQLLDRRKKVFREKTPSALVAGSGP